MTNFYNQYSHAFDPPPTEHKEGFFVPGYRLGAPTSPMHAKQLEEFGKGLNRGLKNIEVGTLSLEKFETIPKQHFEEIRRLSKLSGANVSVHGPLIELAGFNTQQGTWNEQERISTEQHVASIMDRSHMMDPEGNIPIVFHASQMQSQEFDVSLGKKDENGIIQPGIRTMTVINPEDGRIAVVKHEEMYRLDKAGEKEEKEVWDVFKKLKSMNKTQWDEEKLKMQSFQKEIDELRSDVETKEKQNFSLLQTGLANDPEYKSLYEKNKLDLNVKSQHIENLHSRLASAYDSTFDHFKKYADKETKEKYQETFDSLIKNYKEYQENIEKNYNELINLNKKAESLVGGYKTETDLPEEKKLKFIELKKEVVEKQKLIHDLQLDQTKVATAHISAMPTPQMLVPVKDFAKEQAAKTISGALLTFYKTHKKDKGYDINKTPLLAIENFFPFAPMSRGEDLRDAIHQARNIFSKRLIEEEGFEKKKAEDAASKLIGATWDVGHINALRKAGYTEEELRKAVIDETKKIGKEVKHVHITDNFGFHDSHLPPGMGTVPVREMLKELEERGFTGRSIVEAGAFVAEFGVNPQHDILEFFESPLYKTGATVPYWTPETRTSYFDNFVELPQQHFNLYGSNFTTLPKTFGGQVGNDSSRFSGTPNT